jgi:hypothetical protein
VKSPTAKMSQMRCSNPECRSTDIDLNESSGEAVCVRCGTVCEESTIVTVEGTEGYLADRRSDFWGGRPPRPPSLEPRVAISAAAIRGDVESVRRLLASGASPNSFDPEVDPESPEAYETPILAMCKVRGFTDGRAACLELLRDAGADLEAADGDGMTPLHYAARRGDTKIVSLLVDEGVDVDAKAWSYGNHFKCTALHLAVRQRATGCVKVLLAAGASPNLREFDGSTPFGVAINTCHPRTWPLFLRAGAEIPTDITHPYIVRVRNAGGFKKYAQAHLARVTKTVESVLGLPARPAHLVAEFWLHHAGYY